MTAWRSISSGAIWELEQDKPKNLKQYLLFTKNLSAWLGVLSLKTGLFKVGGGKKRSIVVLNNLVLSTANLRYPQTPSDTLRYPLPWCFLQPWPSLCLSLSLSFSAPPPSTLPRHVTALIFPSLPLKLQIWHKALVRRVSPWYHNAKLWTESWL